MGPAQILLAKRNPVSACTCCSSVQAMCPAVFLGPTDQSNEFPLHSNPREQQSCPTAATLQTNRTPSAAAPLQELSNGSCCRRWTRPSNHVRRNNWSKPTAASLLRRVRHRSGHMSNADSLFVYLALQGEPNRLDRSGRLTVCTEGADLGKLQRFAVPLAHGFLKHGAEVTPGVRNAWIVKPD